MSAFTRFVAVCCFHVALLLGLAAPLHAQLPFDALHKFAGGLDGLDPMAAVIQATDGNFYGTTLKGGGGSPCTGGAGGCGTVFKMLPGGTTTVLHAFAGGADGDSPEAPLVEATDGNLYGTTMLGGNPGCGGSCGVIFRISKGGAYTIIHSFVPSEVGAPRAALIQASDGKLYGTAGGSVGAIFRIALDGSVFETVHDFTHTFTTEGGVLIGNPILQAADGNIYGTTCNGGPDGGGTAFRMTLAGALVVLHSFAGGTTDGARPCNGLLQGLDANFYGLTQRGGLNDAGTVFKMVPGGAVTVLHSFSSTVGQGTPLYTTLIQGSDGNFYGNVETFVFKMAPDGTVTSLHNGGAFFGPVLHGRDGNFYGVESFGVNYNGDVFRLGSPSTCDDALTLTYVGGTLDIGFTLKTPTPASWSAWIGVQGQFFNLWSSVGLPAVSPAAFIDLPIPGFPHVGQVIVLTALTTGSGLCFDWKTVNTQ